MSHVPTAMVAELLFFIAIVLLASVAVNAGAIADFVQNFGW